MSEQKMPAAQRLYYLDWLRVAVILTLIPFHAALTYSGLGDTYILAPLHDARIIPFMLVVSPLGNFFMTLLFFVSGAASFFSIQFRGTGGYMAGRARKLLIPFLLGTLFLCPLQAYWKALYEVYTGGFLAFIPRFFAQFRHYMGYAHLWFLLYLFVFSALLLPLFRRFYANPERLARVSGWFARGNRLLLPMAFIVLAEACLRWLPSGGLCLVGDWANDVVYLASFLFGFVFASSGEIQQKIRRYFTLSAVLVPLCLAVFFYTFWMWAVAGSGAHYLTALWVLAKGVYECAAIVLLLCLGMRHFNKPGPQLSYLGGASFTYYLFHFLPVSLFTYVFLRLRLNIYIRFAATVLLSYLFVALLYELLVKRLWQPWRKRRAGGRAAGA